MEEIAGFHMACSPRPSGTGYPTKLTRFLISRGRREGHGASARARTLESACPGRFPIDRAERRRDHPIGRGAQTSRSVKKTQLNFVIRSIVYCSIKMYLVRGRVMQIYVPYNTTIEQTYTRYIGSLASNLGPSRESLSGQRRSPA